ncbi:MAG: carbon-nitrogen hydrolase [Verrucomicrobiia bacterium]|jgi:N-carbamoylputrescine amidase
MKNNSLKIALIQTSCSEDKNSNIHKTLHYAEEAAKQGAKIVCTQELFATQYFCQSEDHKYFELAEPVKGGRTVKLFQAFSKKQKVVSIVSLFEKRAPGLYHNSAAVIDADGELIGIYRKMHIPDDPLYYEKFYFTPGDIGYRAFQSRYCKIGVLICWDQWFPEAARLTALQGAEIIFYPTAIGWHPKEKKQSGVEQADAWETIQRAHAIANGCFVAACNRVGFESPAGGDGIEFWGQSFISDPFGNIISKASDTQEQIIIADINLDMIDKTRTHWPFLRDRRIDSYQNLLLRWNES